MSEIDNYDIDSYTDIEINDKLHDALPANWVIYTLVIKGEPEYETKELEEVVGELGAYELNMNKKEIGYDQVTVNDDGDVCFVAASGGSTRAKRTSATNQSSSTKSMPLSGKISDPSTLDVDYDQIEPYDLEEMLLRNSWQR
ncbi:hypothetical protein Hanom_Chr02g00120461 [Helianthus anomalus]